MVSSPSIWSPTRLLALESGAKASTRRDTESAREFMRLLEGRRLAYEQAQWQAPTLTIAAQAFLLSVLSDSDVSAVARTFILVAGAWACLAAALALVRLRAREVQYSGAVSYYACEEAGLLDPRPFDLKQRRAPPTHRPSRHDRLFRRLGSARVLSSAYVLWIYTLAAFVVADIATLICTW
jgi:hypothetical protein